MKPDEFRLELQAEFQTDPLLLLFTGIPASGKSTFYQRVLAGRNLDYISLDVVRTRARESAAFEAALAARRSVVIDNTNVTKALRARYIGPAKAAIQKGVNWNDLPIADKRGRAVYRVSVEKARRNGGTVLRNVFQIDEAIPVFSECPEWMDGRLRGVESVE